MRSTIVTLAWDIWLRNRTLVRLAIGIVVFAFLVNLVFPDIRESKPDAGLLNFHLAAAAIFLILAIFSYTEFNTQRGTTGFPHRLFVLPVTTFQLVAVPMISGVAVIELVMLAWMAFALPPEERSMWIPIQAGVYMVLQQTVLWTLPGLKSLRLLVIGLMGVFMIMFRILPFVRRLPDISVMSLLGGVALTAFLISWMYVARERSGAGWAGGSVQNLAASVSEWIPARRDKVFRSPQSALFWFEWRRSGSVLPILVGALLVLVIGPLSWFLRGDGESTQSLLLAVVVMPMMLALPVGKAFSKTDFWSRELSIPGFIAVRPLASVDMVTVKMKLAGVSTAISWLLVLAFLSLWLPLWANIDSLATVRGILWMIYGHRLYPQNAIAALLVIACILLTWRFLVGGLWLGLSGNSRVFAFSSVPYVLVPFFVLPAVLIAEQPIFGWIQDNTGRWLPIVVWIAAAAVVIKFWLAAFTWRKINAKYLRQYLPVWLGGSACLAALSFLLGDLLGDFVPADTFRLRSLLILIALQIIPLARIGLAPSFLDKNRHR